MASDAIGVVDRALRACAQRRVVAASTAWSALRTVEQQKLTAEVAEDAEEGTTEEDTMLFSATSATSAVQIRCSHRNGALVRSQRLERIEARGTSRWRIRRENCDAKQYDTDDSERHWIAGLDAV